MTRETFAGDVGHSAAELESDRFEFHGVGGFAVEHVQDGGGIFLEGRDVLAVEEGRTMNGGY